MFLKLKLEHLVYGIGFFLAAILSLLQNDGYFRMSPMLLFLLISVFNLIMYAYKVTNKVPDKGSIDTYIWWNLSYGILFIGICVYMVYYDGASIYFAGVQMFLAFGVVEMFLFLYKLFRSHQHQVKN